MGAKELSEEMAKALTGHDYSEVEGNEITGVEGELSWLIVAILGSPVISKILDVLEKSVARRKISKVTISKDGKVEIEGATPDEAAKILRSLQIKEDGSESN
jgi:hypothetical protein